MCYRSNPESAKDKVVKIEYQLPPPGQPIPTLASEAPPTASPTKLSDSEVR